MSTNMGRPGNTRFLRFLRLRLNFNFKNVEAVLIDRKTPPHSGVTLLAKKFGARQGFSDPTFYHKSRHTLGD